MEKSVSGEGSTKEPLNVPFRFLRNGDADNPGVRIKCRFVLIPSDYESDLEDSIMKNGGDVLGDFSSKEDAEYAVTLLDERYYMKNSTKNSDLPLDTFSSIFIGDAIKSSRNSLPLPDLNKYRLTPSKYSPYDANEILLQQTKWSDLVPLANPPSSKFTARKVIAEYEAAATSLTTPCQETEKTDKEVTAVVTTSNSPQTSAARSNQAKVTPVKLAPNPVLGVTPPRIKHPKPVQKVFASPACDLSGSKQRSPPQSTDQTDKSPGRGARGKRGKHDGWLSEEEGSVSGHENNDDNNDSSDYSLSEGETNMYKRPKLVPKAYAGPPSAKSKKSVQKSKATRSTNSIAKALVGYDNDEGWLPSDVSRNDIDDDCVSVISSVSSTGTRKGPKLTFSKEEGQRMLDLICDKKAFMYTKGNRLWQQLAQSGLFPGRTHQSLKEHWRKKVLPNALQKNLYDITLEQCSLLKKAQERMKWSQHANICPDYKFETKN